MSASVIHLGAARAQHHELQIIVAPGIHLVLGAYNTGRLGISLVAPALATLDHPGLAVAEARIDDVWVADPMPGDALYSLEVEGTSFILPGLADAERARAFLRELVREARA